SGRSWALAWALLARSPAELGVGQHARQRAEDRVGRAARLVEDGVDRVAVEHEQRAAQRALGVRGREQRVRVLRDPREPVEVRLLAVELGGGALAALLARVA